MPVLNWIGKDKVVNHDKELPFRVLKPVKELSVGENSENLLIEGDNLEALKALMPFYYGKVDFIYIDPPYNTGFEGWKYNDKVNSPQIKSWINETVGPEGEDLCRHDKWLCMIYPRIKLLKDLLNDKGVIFVSIDDNEVNNLRNVMNEIFGEANFVNQIVWRKKYGGGAKTKFFVDTHEYILCYSKNKQTIKNIQTDYTEKNFAYYKYKDEKFEKRGPYRLQPLATNSNDERPNLRYPIRYEGIDILPEKQWQWSKDRYEQANKNNEIVFNKSKSGSYSVNFKQYLRDEEGNERKSKPFSIIDGIFTQHGTNEIKKIFGDGQAFPFPKPVNLIKELIKIQFSDSSNKDITILDSFAGSGTTAQAVLELNKEDNGNRRFILVELDKEIANNVTTKRLNKVIRGFEGALFPEGTGQGYQYLDLNGELYGQSGFVNPDAKYEDMAAYIYFTETKRYLDIPSIKNPYIGSQGSTNYFLFFEGKGNNILDEKTLKKTEGYKGHKVIYADKCLIDNEHLEKLGVTFKQIPYELKKY